MPLIHLKDRFVEYKFEVLNKYTLIQDDSAAGKTTLYELIREFEIHPDNVQCPGYFKLRVMPAVASLREAAVFLESSSDTVFFIDEDDSILRLKGYECVLKESANYFVMIFRYHLIPCVK